MPRKVEILFLLCDLSFEDKMSQQCAFSERKGKKKKVAKKALLFAVTNRSAIVKADIKSMGWHGSKIAGSQKLLEYWIPRVKDSQGDCGAGRRMYNNLEMRSSAMSSATWEGKFGVCD